MKQAACVSTDTELRKVLGLASSGSIGKAKKNGKIPHKWLLEIHRQFNADIRWLETGETPAGQVSRLDRRHYQPPPEQGGAAQTAIEMTSSYWTAKTHFVEKMVELLREHGASDDEIRDVIREHVRDTKRQ